MSKRPIIATASLALAIILALTALYLWLLASPNPLTAPTASRFPWPVACSSKGCVTTTAWHQHTITRRSFAATTDGAEPTTAETLTTLIRQHLAHEAQLHAPITDIDAARYREDILNVTGDDQLTETIPLTVEEYDEQVVTPFLEQENLRQQLRAETPDDLYQQLAQERFIIVLPFHFSWDKTTATVR